MCTLRPELHIVFSSSFLQVFDGIITESTLNSVMDVFIVMSKLNGQFILVHMDIAQTFPGKLDDLR